jgi:hypothetical protein
MESTGIIMAKSNGVNGKVYIPFVAGALYTRL